MRLRAVRLLRRVLMSCASAAILTWAVTPALAQDVVKKPQVEEPNGAAVDRLEQSVLQQAQKLEAQQRELERQTKALAEKQQELTRQIAELKALRGDAGAMQQADALRAGQGRAPGADTVQLSSANLLQLPESPIEKDAFAALRAGQLPASQAQTGSIAGGQASAPLTTAGPALTVGAPPPESDQPAPQLAALPESIGVLTPPGKFVLDPSLEYSNTAGNRLVFRGVEIVTGVQIGVIEASDVDRNSVTGTLAGRLGLTNRLEVEVRVPYLYRNDEITTLAQRDQTITRTTQLEGSDLGDIEVAARYQLTDGRDGWPIMVGNLRYKSKTGTGPFDVSRDEFGIADELPTGSGFWGIEPSLTFLMPSDPAVLFATIGYLYHAADNVDKMYNGVLIGKVDPGDSINGSLGFGFAVNQNFSFSMGYRHSYITRTKTFFDDTWQKSDDLQAGSIQMGLSYRFNERQTVNTSFEFGVTEDAPDARIVLRIPFSS